MVVARPHLRETIARLLRILTNADPMPIGIEVHQVPNGTSDADGNEETELVGAEQGETVQSSADAAGPETVAADDPAAAQKPSPSF